MTTRADVVACARTWLGTPFHHASRLKHVGVDCAGLVIGVARELSLVAPDFDLPAYTPSPDGHTMIEWCNRYMTPVNQDAMQPGDVVVLITDVHPQHLGILGNYQHGGLSIIHAASTSITTGWVVETRLMFSRAHRYVASFALPGVA